MMAQDTFFVDRITNKYTVDRCALVSKESTVNITIRYLDDLTQRYGGIDSVLVWPSYPNLGIVRHAWCDAKMITYITLG